MDPCRKKELRQAQRRLEDLLRTVELLRREHQDEVDNSEAASINVDRRALLEVFEAYTKLVG